MNFKKKLFVIVFMAILVGSFNINTSTIQAITADEIQAQIQALLLQITQLQKQLDDSKGGQVSWCYDFNRNLKYGSGGSDVIALQTALEKSGFAEVKKDSSGNFGIYTSSAVVGFQERYASETLAPWGLTRGTGFVGSTTLKKLNAIYGCGVVPPTVPDTTPTIPDDSCHTTPSWSWNYCSSNCKCDAGQGDCDKDTDCNTGYCAHNVGAKYGQSSGMDVCEERDEPTSSIRVISPNGGETLTAGSAYDITWTSQNVEKVQIGFIEEGAGEGDIANNISASLGKYTWTVPSSYEGNYKISIQEQGQGGASDVSDSYFSIVEPEPSITVTSPNGGEEWKEGDTHTISWDSTGVDKIRIKVYCGSMTPQDIFTQSISADIGKYLWEIPVGFNGNRGEPECGLKIYDESNSSIYDENDYSFTIKSTEIAQSITLTSPNGGEQWIKGQTYDITWTTSFASDELVKIVLNTKDGYSAAIIAQKMIDTGSYSWDISKTAIGMGATLPAGDYEIEMCKGSICDKSDSYFSIVDATPEKSITVTSPNGGESVEQGKTLIIKWDVIGIYEDVMVSIVDYTNFVNSVEHHIDYSASAGLQAYHWRVPSDFSVGNKYKIKVEKCDGTKCYLDESDNYFSITEMVSSITLLAPNGGEILTEGEECIIEWESFGLKSSDEISINIFKEDGLNGVIGKVSATQNSYNWTIDMNNLGWGYGYSPMSQVLASLSSDSSDKYKIWLNVYSQDITDGSDDYFSITDATPVCTDTDGGKDYYVKGAVTIKKEGYQTTYMDNCYSSNLLNEGYCENGEMQSIEYICPHLCQNGRCVASVPCDSYGDMDSDSYITKEDVDILFDIVDQESATDEQKKRGDVNGNGRLDFDDTVKLNQYLVGDIDTLPVCTELAKSITITSPNGGEILTAGSIYEITWDSVGIDKVKISVCGETPLLSEKYSCWELSGMGYGVDASVGKYAWNIDKEAFYIPGQLKLRIEDFVDESMLDESDNYFNIVDTKEKDCGLSGYEWTDTRASKTACENYCNDMGFSESTVIVTGSKTCAGAYCSYVSDFSTCQQSNIRNDGNCGCANQFTCQCKGGGAMGLESIEAQLASLSAIIAQLAEAIKK